MINCNVLQKSVYTGAVGEYVQNTAFEYLKITILSYNYTITLTFIRVLTSTSILLASSVSLLATAASGIGKCTPVHSRRILERPFQILYFFYMYLLEYKDVFIRI